MSIKQNFMQMFAKQDFAALYSNIAETVTGPFAEALVDISGVAKFIQKPLAVFDNACGTGIVSKALHDMVDSQVQKDWQLTCGDFSNVMVEFTKKRIQNEEWPNAEAKVINAQDTGISTGYYTHIFVAFAFQSFPDPDAALKECFRVLQPGGLAASSTWQNNNWIGIVKSAIETLPGNLPFPTAKEFFSMFNAGWDSESFVRSRYEKEGFEDVQTTVVIKHISMPVPTFLKFIQPVTFPVLGKIWTQGQRDAYEKDVLLAVKRYVEEEYGADGSVTLELETIVTTARKPLTPLES
ncbi:hypothetical protein EYZ11_002749 [Aspergillus tanneri]|uniref:Methyltransferase domain-containing protein n=1 Tax=Aspergillus tanneri TaxID=1220188 RepID=A0A4S3JS69_9EURO|nr:uncharacterized protein ATNIH1004_003307 [Aspergillus tanneri]KAA8650620.1 hypothetical protein ATNIH1004_003307 [Aspergillus tanneri]THC97767.1 hypothetical protein EYZ11_002749 [Aspergillus tanneri]